MKLDSIKSMSEKKNSAASGLRRSNRNHSQKLICNRANLSTIVSLSFRQISLSNEFFAIITNPSDIFAANGIFIRWRYVISLIILHSFAGFPLFSVISCVFVFLKKLQQRISLCILTNSDLPFLKMVSIAFEKIKAKPHAKWGYHEDHLIKNRWNKQYLLFQIPVQTRQILRALLHIRQIECLQTEYNLSPSLYL